MATGDLKNNLRKLQFELRTIKYDRDVDFESLGRGIPPAFLPIYHYAFVEYSHPLAKKILDMNLEMYSKTDLRFIETMYKVLRELFGYKPTITKEQFFNPGFGERKVMMCCEIIHQIQEMHRTLVGGVRTSAKNPKANQTVHVTSSRTSTPQSTESRTSSTESPQLAEYNHSVKNLNPMNRLSLHIDSNQRSSPLVPLVISEKLSTVTREPALCSSDASQETMPVVERELRAESRLRLDNGQALDVAGRIDYDRMILNETRISSQQAIIDNICEKLSEVISRVSSLEERLTNLSCDKCVANAASEDSNSQQLEHSIGNVVARVTLLENRLNFLEKQSKPLFPALGSLVATDGNVTEVVNKVYSDRMSNYSSSSTKPVKATCPEPVSSSVLTNTSVESVNNTTKSQSERIEAMLRETDELLMENFKRTPIADGYSTLCEEKSDSSKETSYISH